MPAQLLFDENGKGKHAMCTTELQALELYGCIRTAEICTSSEERRDLWTVMQISLPLQTSL